MKRFAALLLVFGVAMSAVAMSASENKRKKTAVEANAQRQITNAIDAGDGDYDLRALRQKLVAEPSSLTARLALGAAYEQRGVVELALDHYRIAIDQYGSEIAASRLARALDGLGESEQALDVLVRFCNSHQAASSRILFPFVFGGRHGDGRDKKYSRKPFHCFSSSN